jgi:isoleucyl-tRNA synthetase
VRDVRIVQRDEDLVDLSATANFKALGKKVGKKMQQVASAVAAMSVAQIRAVEAGGSFNVDEFELTAKDILIKRTEKPGMAILSDQGMSIALDIQLTPELIAEGLARDVVHHIQNLRKEKDFEITDRIRIALQAQSESLRIAIQSFKEYICRETLALDLTFNESPTGTELKTGDHVFTIDIQRTDASPVRVS